MKILILDDMVERHEGFLKHFAGHDITHCWTYLQAVTAMRETKFDIACLDHDLGDLTKGGKVKVDSEHFKLEFRPDYSTEGYGGGKSYYTGADVAWWLKNNPGYCPSKILVHSHNPDGANNIALLLKSIPGVEVSIKPYSAPV